MGLTVKRTAKQLPLGPLAVGVLQIRELIIFFAQS